MIDKKTFQKLSRESVCQLIEMKNFNDALVAEHPELLSTIYSISFKAWLKSHTFTIPDGFDENEELNSRYLDDVTIRSDKELNIEAYKIIKPEQVDEVLALNLLFNLTLLDARDLVTKKYENEKPVATAGNLHPCVGKFKDLKESIQEWERWSFKPLTNEKCHQPAPAGAETLRKLQTVLYRRDIKAESRYNIKALMFFCTHFNSSFIESFGSTYVFREMRRVNGKMVVLETIEKVISDAKMTSAAGSPLFKLRKDCLGILQSFRSGKAGFGMNTPLAAFVWLETLSRYKAMQGRRKKEPLYENLLRYLGRLRSDDD